MRTSRRRFRPIQVAGTIAVFLGIGGLFFGSIPNASADRTSSRDGGKVLDFKSADEEEDSGNHPVMIAPYAYGTLQPLQLDSIAFGNCLAIATYASVGSHFYNAISETHTFPIHLSGKRARADHSFFGYLAASKNRPADYVSGNEEQLRKWVLRQRHNSIDPLLLYEESLRINRGNLFNALLTNYQLLRNEARFYDRARYDYPSDISQQGAFFARFIDIRGDLKETAPTKRVGDLYGTWYRIWGAALFRLSLIPELEFNQVVPKLKIREEGRFQNAESGTLNFFKGVVTEQIQGLKDNARTAMSGILFYGDEILEKRLMKRYLWKQTEDLDSDRKFEFDLASSYAIQQMTARLTSLDFYPDSVAQKACKNRVYLVKNSNQK